ncbi:MAG: hypothetical protein RLZZ116_2630, partial [Planctomycetota bacterium]
MKQTLIRVFSLFHPSRRTATGSATAQPSLDAMLMAGQDGGGSGNQGGGGPQGGPPVPPQQQRGGQQVFTFVMIAAMIGLVILALQSFSRPTEVTWTTFKELVEQKKIYDGTDPRNPQSG